MQMVPNSAIYNIDSAASKLHILVYRGGSMARLGHNHVVSSHSVRGNVWLGDSLTSSGFEFSVPVNEFRVDDDSARLAEANMLRDTLLDGNRYPDIRIRSVDIVGTFDAPVVRAEVQIKDRARTFAVPVTVQREDTHLRIQGAFELAQSAFGITPLSIAMGALTVVDTVKVKFELIANDKTQEPASSPENLRTLHAK
ncbi:MAG: hypothetical protein CFE44_09785 [Burkholderiales bacterium PBB4]|nr:MAG: hypothetical protein CFE44_09785 [Burkholderiales bacterium PBB4]